MELFLLHIFNTSRGKIGVRIMEQTLQEHRVVLTDTRRLLCPDSPLPSWFPAQLQKAVSRHSRSREGLAASYSATIEPPRRGTFTCLRYYHVQHINTEPVSLCHVRIGLAVGCANLVAHKSGKERTVAYTNTPRRLGEIWSIKLGKFSVLYNTGWCGCASNIRTR
jgi:hypothetical protein